MSFVQHSPAELAILKNQYKNRTVVV